MIVNYKHSASSIDDTLQSLALEIIENLNEMFLCTDSD